MVELIFCSAFVLLLGAAHFVAAVIYKIKTKSPRSIWWIMDNEI